MHSVILRRWILAAATLASVATVGYYAVRSLDQRLADNFEHKLVRETTATVVKKEHVQFDKSNNSYQHEDGYTVFREAGAEEWRIYYLIDNFDQIPDPLRSALLKAEQERADEQRPRFTIVSKDQFDAIKAGDKLNVGWRWRGRGYIEIVTAGKPTSQND